MLKSISFVFVQIANMKKEINAIQVKDISQGGLTQGQQTQIARNEQRIAQVLLEKSKLDKNLVYCSQYSLNV